MTAKLSGGGAIYNSRDINHRFKFANIEEKYQQLQEEANGQPLLDGQHLELVTDFIKACDMKKLLNVMVDGDLEISTMLDTIDQAKLNDNSDLKQLIGRHDSDEEDEEEPIDQQQPEK